MNGVYLCPNYSELSGIESDYAGTGSKILLARRLKVGDILIIEKTFLGITYSRKFYRIVEPVLPGGYWRRVATVLTKASIPVLPPAPEETA